MLKVATHPFVSALARAVPVCRSSMPDFLSVSLASCAEGLRIGAQNGDVSVEIAVPSEGKLEARLPANRLLAVARAMVGESLEFANGRKNAVSISSGRFESTMAAAPQTADMAVKISQATIDATLPLETLREALQKTIFAVGDDETRAALNGIHVVVGASALELVGTDGRRLAVAQVEAKIARGADAKFTIPREAVNLFLKAVAGEEGEVALTSDGARLALKTATTDFRTKLVDLAYPAWRRVIPDDADLPVSFAVNRDALADSLNRSLIIDADRVSLDIDGSTLRLSTVRAEVGESDDTVAVTRPPGKTDRLRVAFAPRNLTEALAAVRADDLQLAVGQQTPMVMRAGSWRYVVMPLVPAGAKQ